ncbi:hypothetical protein QTP86_019641 [Hemibagrus guttatus]|nr:hypothetical protein QTP86_019641 [Hemibagrus guttatus]
MKLLLSFFTLTCIKDSSAQITHVDIILNGCSESDKEFEVENDGEELGHSDFKKQVFVKELPDFTDPMDFSGFYEQSVSVQDICKHNLDLAVRVYKNPPEALDVPENAIYSKRNVELGAQNTLICHSARFFPPPVHIRWTKNSVDVTDKSSLSQFYPNEDNTFNQFSHLHFTPQEGDVYTCTVEHKALDTPDTRTWGDEEVMGKFGVKERNLEGQMVVDFAKRMDMGVVNTYFQKREEHRVTYKSGGRRTQVDYILCRRGNLKEISDCKVVVGESVARQHRMVVCRMTLMVCKKKRSEIEKKTKWWKLKKEECCEEFRQKLRQALGGQVVLPDDWETTAEVIRETGRKVLGVSSGRRKEDKETWWWNEEVQDSIQRKRLAKKKLDTREGEKDLYRLARQRDGDGKDVQQVRVIKDRDGRVLTSEESVQRRWKEYFEELINEENEREKRVEGVNSVEQKVDKIRKDEVRKALKRMKSGKAVGPDDIPVEVWKCLGEAAVEFLTSLFNRVLESERMPEEWRRSVLVPIFKNKGDVQSCSNYRGIKLMSHTMKLWERVVEARLRKVVEICEQQYGFMPRKSTTDAIFALRILMEKYRDGQRELHCVFVDLEKAYDRVPREELWYCMRKSGVAEKYVRVVQDMYERSRTVVRCAVGQTEEFKVEVGLHQGSALSPFLFAMVMDQLSEEVRQDSSWTMMFADDIVICSESREQVEENLERWRFALERRGMKVSGSKTEYMCVNEREGSGTVRLQSEEVKKVQEFKYLGSTVQSNGECGKEVKKRVQAGWNGWRKVWGVLCDRKISARIKGKVYRTVVRAAMLYGLETVSLRRRQESELEVAELKMLRFSLGVTRLDRIRNEYIRGTAHVGRLGDKVREARLRWFGHVQRRENGYFMERRSQCIYSSRDLSDMVYIDSYIFNKVRYKWFNNTVGKFQGYTPHGIYNAELWNNDTALLQQERAEVDNVCKHNAQLYYPAMIDKSVQPEVIVKSVKKSDGSHPAVLMCSAYNFYPKIIKVTWLRNGKEVQGGQTSTEEMADGDWYYQIHSHLEYKPESGEEISCVVEHASFKKPMVYKWDPSASAHDKSKIAIGASGLVLGVVLSAAGFIYYRKKCSGLQVEKPRSA